jgi:predicted enzyme related to lactoylglutathione lyase
MFKPAAVFSTFAVPDIEAARRFYGETLGLDVRDDANAMGMLQLSLGNGADVMIYPKPDHKPAVFTILNFVVPDIEAAVTALTESGVKMQRYDMDGGMEADSKGIYRGQGPAIAWFTDPAGNILAVIEQSPAS